MPTCPLLLCSLYGDHLQVFNQAALKAGEDMPASWRESLWRMYKSGSQTVRVAVYGKSATSRYVTAPRH